jgi:hypothetical protein
VIRKEAWPFYRTTSGVRLCWELEEPEVPKGPSVQCSGGSLHRIFLTLFVPQPSALAPLSCCARLFPPTCQIFLEHNLRNWQTGQTSSGSHTAAPPTLPIRPNRPISGVCPDRPPKRDGFQGGSGMQDWLIRSNGGGGGQPAALVPLSFCSRPLPPTNPHDDVSLKAASA